MVSGPVTRMILDTDGGVDDAVALWWALTAPGVDVVAITTVHGNVGVEQATTNVCRILEAAGRGDVPVGVGAADPLGPVPDLRPADFIHGADGLGNTNRAPASFGAGPDSATELLRRHAAADVTVVTLGPLTNIGHLLTEDPGWAGRIGRLVVMGGTVAGPGNALPQAEANIAHDPRAAAIVARAAWAHPPLLVGLDVTNAATLDETELALLAEERNAAARFVAEPLAFYARYGGTFAASGVTTCHDLVAVLAAARPGIVTGPVLPLAVQDSPGPAWGATIADRRVPYFARLGPAAEQSRPAGFGEWEIALDVDVTAVRAEFRRLVGG